MRHPPSLPFASRLAVSILSLAILAACGGGGGGDHDHAGGSLPGAGGTGGGSGGGGSGGTGGGGGTGSVGAPVPPVAPVNPVPPAVPVDPVNPAPPATPPDPVTPTPPATPPDPVTPTPPATPPDPVTPTPPAAPPDPVPPATPPDPADPAPPLAPIDPDAPVDPGGAGIAGWRPTSPTPVAPAAAAFDGAGVNVGVIDNGFPADPTTDHHQAAIAGVLRRVIAPEAAEATDEHGAIKTHGAIVSRIIGGQVVAGDSFPKGSATGIGLYQANLPSTFNALVLHARLTSLTASGVTIVNNSWSFATEPEYALPGGDQAKADSPIVMSFFPILDTAVTRNGQLLIWANGNESQPNPYLLAGAPYVAPPLERGWLTVAQLLADGNLAPWSNACGVAANWCISTRSPDDAKLTGTSFAAPVVAATAALVSQAYPWMDNSALRQTLLSTADDMGDRARFGWGRLNPDRAVRGPALFDTRLTLSGDFVADFNARQSAFFNDIGGNAGLTKNGTGELVLWGANHYAGATTINRGTLTLYGSVASDIAIQADGALGADGGVAGGSVRNNGALAAYGNGLHIMRDYDALRPEAKLTIQLGTTVTIDGQAALNDSGLVIAKPDDSYLVRHRETALKAGQVAGRFGTVAGSAGLLYSVSPNYSATQVDLDVARNNVATVAHSLYAGQTSRLAAAQAVETAFQAADATALGDDANVSDTFMRAAAKLQAVGDAAALATALDSLSGQIHASSQALTFQQSQAVNRVLSNRVDDLSLPGARTGPWVDMAGGNGRLRQAGFAGADTRLFGGQFGVDQRLGDAGIVGVAFNWSEAKADFDRYGGRARSQGTGLSLYGRYGADGGPYVAGRAGHAWIHADIQRDILAGGADHLDSGRDDRLISLYVEAGHAFDLDGTRLTPFVGLSHDHLRRGAIHERDSAFGLKADAKSYGQSAALLGLRLQSSPLDWAGGATTFSGYGAYRYGNATPLDFTAAFAGAPDASFQVQGIGLPRHTGWLGLGAHSLLGNRVSWFIQGDLQFGQGGLANTVLSTGLRYWFD